MPPRPRPSPHGCRNGNALVTTRGYDRQVPESPTILVFDSGLGGLTVLREIVRARPEVRDVYVADDAFFPYGQHSEAELIARVVPLMGDLIAAHRPDLVVIACNTASTLVLSHLRAAYQVPFVGTVPAIKPACARSKTKRVSVLGTLGTVRREYTQGLIRDFAQGCQVKLVGSAHLAALTEAALNGDAVSDAAVAAEIAPCFVEEAGARTDIVVLACTHYPFLVNRMRKMAPWPVDWIDTSEAIARRAASLIAADAPSQMRGEVLLDDLAVFTAGRPGPVTAKLLRGFGLTIED